MPELRLSCPRCGTMTHSGIRRSGSVLRRASDQRRAFREPETAECSSCGYLFNFREDDLHERQRLPDSWKRSTG